MVFRDDEGFCIIKDSEIKNSSLWGSIMIFIIEGIVLCALFTLMVYIMSRNPIKTLYNYPPKIQERVMTLDEYKDQVPTRKNKVVAKVGASVLFVVILALILRFINGYTTFLQAFGYGFLLWTIVNAYDANGGIRDEN